MSKIVSVGKRIVVSAVVVGTMLAALPGYSYAYNIGNGNAQTGEEKTTSAAEIIESPGNIEVVSVNEAATKPDKEAETKPADKEEPGQDKHKTTPFEEHGALHLEGTQMQDEHGDPFQLRGVSMASINYDHWYTYMNKETLKYLRDEWKCNTIRIPMYTANEGDCGYCTGDDELKALLEKRVDESIALCTDLGMYVIFDWHTIMEGNPNVYLNESMAFHDELSEEYADYDNLIYEICNEPNNLGEDDYGAWQTIKNYADQVIPVIRENAPDSIVIVGTPNNSGTLYPIAGNPLEFENVMYTEHVYASNDWSKDARRNDMLRALGNGIPVAVTEINPGIAEDYKTDDIDAGSFDAWISAINNNTVPLLFFALCKEDCSCAIIEPGVEKLHSWSKSELSNTGRFVENELKNGMQDPE